MSGITLFLSCAALLAVGIVYGYVNGYRDGKEDSCYGCDCPYAKENH